MCWKCDLADELGRDPTEHEIAARKATILMQYTLDKEKKEPMKSNPEEVLIAIKREPLAHIKKTLDDLMVYSSMNEVPLVVMAGFFSSYTHMVNAGIAEAYQPRTDPTIKVQDLLNAVEKEMAKMQGNLFATGEEQFPKGTPDDKPKH